MLNGDIGAEPVRFSLIATIALLWHLVVFQGLGGLVMRVSLEDANIKLKDSDKILFKSYFCGMIHSTVLTVLSIVLFTEIRNWTDEQKMFGYHDLGVLSCEMFLGFLLQDTIYLIYYSKQVDVTEYLVHHIAYMAIGCYALPNSYMIYAYMWLSIGEASSPFLAIRWFLSIFKLKDSILYTINGLLFTSLFFITRVVIFGAGLLHLYRSIPVWWDRALGLRFVFFGLIAMYGLNLFWWTKVYRGLRKTLSKSKVKSS